MIYVPVIYTKPAEIKLGSKALVRLSDSRVKPYLRLMRDTQCASPNDFLAGLGLYNSMPFIGIPRITNPDTIKSAKSELIKNANYSEENYFKAEVGLLVANAIVVYDCNAPESDYAAFVELCHHNKRPCALYTDHLIDFGVLNQNDYVLFNVKQDIYALEDTVDYIRSNTDASIILIRENRSLQTTNKSLDDGDEVDANGFVIFGDLSREIIAKNIQIKGFGDFGGWKNTVNVQSGGRGQAIKTIALYDRKAWHFKVLKELPKVSLKTRVRQYMQSRDPNDSIGTVQLMESCIDVGNPGQFNALSIYHYIQEMLLNDDWSIA